MAPYWICYVLLFIGTTLVLFVNGYTISDVKTLKHKLFTDANYDKSMRPIFNQSNAIEVSDRNVTFRRRQRIYTCITAMLIIT